MFNLQGSEIIVILLLALVILGPEKLPDAIRRFSQTYAELKKMGSGFQTELKSALDEPMKEMRETAELLQNAADPQKIAEQAAAENVAAATEEADDPDGPDDRPQGVTDPGSDTVATATATAADDEPDPVPINKIAAANASSALSAGDLDEDADADTAVETADGVAETEEASAP